MTFVRSAARTLGFTCLYLAATYAGRLTVMDDTNLSLVWPAAGVSAVWFVAQRGSRWRWLDVLALTAVTLAVNTATGAPARLAAAFVAANLAQAFVFSYLSGRWLPQLGGGGRAVPLARLADLWRLVAAAGIATTSGALIGPTAVWLDVGTYSWPAAAVWLARNTVSILLVGVAGFRLAHLLSRWRDRPARRRPAPTVRGLVRGVSRRIEYVLVTVLSAGGYVLAFGVLDALPVSFALIVMTVWAGLRLHTTFVIVHDVVFGSLAVLFTLHGQGAFAQIPAHPVRALVAQLFVGTVAVVGLALALGRDERAVLFHRLAASERAAARQARLLTTIVDSMTEGLGVIDEEGRFLLRNRAAGQLVGGVTGTTGSAGDSASYGLYRPDGTPLPADEMPHRQALAGTDVLAKDVLVRNAALPEGRILSVNATRLPAEPDGSRHAAAVVVFHDVTADRRQRDELTSFAGVVAHDLLNPLTTVEGWTEALQEAVDEVPDGPAAADARDSIVRIRRAAARMRNLINDLLAHTTARDATLAPTTVHLGELVDDIAAARADLAATAGRPRPQLRVGDLHPVDADPVLLRQLLDNVIGNAVTYTAPGSTPEIGVTSELTPDGLVRVHVVDNGIGIPAGQHDAVFHNFHRAHRGAGYPGTGLGLAICRRIVERHGGTITAAPRAGRPGTHVCFTLPAAALEGVGGSGPRRPGDAQRTRERDGG
jgi:signal transduction histidine kinase/integral membrane sensor domain MASE1